MASFKTHMATSSLLGIGYGAAAYVGYDVPLSTCMLAGGLCSVSGMLPDIDSNTGVPIRESMAFAAAVVPMLMIDRFQHMGLNNESIALAGALIYLLIRFGLPEILKRFTVHRGMWHSVPAAAIAGLLAFMICSGEGINLRLFKSGGVLAGYVSHLLLDELFSIEWYRGRLRLKKSFGTALKMWGKSPWANITTYGKLTALVVLAIGDPLFMENHGFHPPSAHHVTHEEPDYQID